MLEIKNLYGAYDKDHWIVSDISVKLDYGDALSVLGQNGSGKSTFAKTIMGTIPFTKGKIELEGIDITNYSTQRKVTAGMAWCMQDENIFPQLTVLENLRIASKLLTDQQQKKNNRILSDYLTLLQNHKRKLVKATYLSKGECQQLGLAMAILSSPNLKCLILDEPSAGLSQDNMLYFFNLLKLITNDMHLICILIEQNKRIANSLCNKTLEI